MKQLQVNTLVTHKTKGFQGIGCIAKVKGIKSPKYVVNTGLEGFMTVSATSLVEVDTKGCKTMSFSEFQSKSISNSFKKDEGTLIIGNVVKEYVGIGWIDIRVATEEDLKNLKRVV
jgi:hypothetical protein